MEKKSVALTFDDGHSNITSEVLDILEANEAKGTFFLIGDNISDASPELIKRQLKLGCEIGNHSLTHSNMTELSAEDIKAEIEETSSRIEKLIGSRPKFFRPPYLVQNDVMFDNIDMPFIHGADSKDWDENVSVEERINNVMDLVKDGAIILMHDFTDNRRTLEALPIIIAKLRDDNYEFVTVSEIFERKGVNPNVQHKCWTYVCDNK
ncbi:MAG: polysaccharide deacetylase family protein [Clostridia bacterium]|nr:polysaccharide deacetylase family protein [Clostridia bacterium]